ncbi:calcium-binding protein [Sorangium sp. So ce260]|uniref:calcium-binding protein n=1 Tax=Sorangium sp. So ce260 TaxID=3133291 RepID=UPI003F641273
MRRLNSKNLLLAILTSIGALSVAPEAHALPWDEIQPKSGIKQGKWEGPHGFEFKWKASDGNIKFEVTAPNAGIYSANYGTNPTAIANGGVWNLPGEGNGVVTYGTDRGIKLKVPVGPGVALVTEGKMNDKWEYVPDKAEVELGLKRSLFTSYKPDKSGVHQVGNSFQTEAKLKLILDGIQSGNPHWGYGIEASILGFEIINEEYVGFGKRELLFNGMVGQLADFMRWRQDYLLDLSQGRAPHMSDVDAELPDMAMFLAFMDIGGDPLAIDLDDDGVETLGLDGSDSVLFDHDGDGVATATGWVAPDDGWIVRDRNLDGQINDGNELFGVDTVKLDGTLAADGLDALSDLDTVNDGVIDAADAGFGALRIWQDLNSNGEAEFGELASLAEMGITSIALSVTGDISGTNGNSFAGTAKYTRDDGTTGIVANLIPTESNFYAEFTTPVTVSPEAEALPYMGGSGFARPLREAMTMDPQLLSLVSEFAAEPTRDGQRRKVHEILARWSQGAPGGSLYHQSIAANIPVWTTFQRVQKPKFDAQGNGAVAYSGGGGGGNSSIGPSNVYSVQSDWGWLPAQGRTETQERTDLATLFTSEAERLGVSGHPRWLKEVLELSDHPMVDSYRQHLARLTVVEVFSGVASRDWNQLSTDAYGKRVTFDVRNTWGFDAAYRLIYERVYGALAAQTRLQSYLDLVPEPTQPGSLDFSALNASLLSDLNSDAGAMARENDALADLVDFVRHAGPALMRFGWDPRPLIEHGLSLTHEATVDYAASLPPPVGGCFWQPWSTPDYSVLRNEDHIGALQDLHSVFFHSWNKDPYNRPDSFLVKFFPGDLCGSFRWFDYTWEGEIANPTRTTPLRYDHHRNAHDLVWNTYHVSAGVGDDLVFVSPEGAERIDGGPGDDTYVVGANYGEVTIVGPELSTDTLQFIDGIRKEDIKVTRADRNLVLEVTSAPAETRTRVSVAGFFYGDANDGTALAEVAFSDGTFWTTRDLRVKALDNRDAGGSILGYQTADLIDAQGGNDLIYGQDGQDFLLGGDGNDSIDGGNHGDYMYGGSGDDSLSGQNGDDVLDDDAGNDHFTGGNGDDLFLVGGLDAGNDIVDDTTGHNRLLLATDVTPEMITIRNDNRNMVIKVTSDGKSRQVAVRSQFDESGVLGVDVVQIGEPAVASWNRAELQEMATTGSTGNDVITAFESADTVSGGDGNDWISGRGGDDDLSGDDGNDSLDGGDQNDRLDGGSGDDSLVGGNHDDQLIGGSGNDTLSGQSGNDVLDGGPGNDHFTGGGGNDTFFVGGLEGGNDLVDDTSGQNRLVLGAGVTPEMVRVRNVNMDMILTIVSNGQSREVKVRGHFGASNTVGVDVVQIGEPATVTWTRADLRSMALIGSPDGDTITGFASADTVSGGAGNDWLYGLDGADVLSGDDGKDTLDGGNHDDQLIGGSGDDSLSGQAGNDVLDGGEGDDHFTGGAGDDTFFVGGLEGGSDLVDDTSGSNRLVLGADVAPEMVRVRNVNRDMILTVTANGGYRQVKVRSQFNEISTLGVDAVQIGEPATATWTREDLRYMALAGTPENDTLVGFESADAISGFAGNDTISGLGGNDSLQGDDGNDSLMGDEGNDTLDGGNGNDGLNGYRGDDLLAGGPGDDSLNGGEGSDTYYYSEGQDIIQNTDVNVASIDTVVFDDALAPGDLVFRKDGFSDLLITVRGSTDTLRISQFLTGNAAATHTIDRFQFGTAPGAAQLTAAEVAHLALYGDGSPINGDESANSLEGFLGADTISGFGGNDTIFAKDGDDTLNGMAGADTLWGEAGADTLNGGSGNDALRGGSGGDKYTFSPGDGTDVIVPPSDGALGDLDIVEIVGSEAVIDGATFRRVSSTTIELRVGSDLVVTIQGFLTGDASSTVHLNNEVDEVRWPDHTLCTKQRIRDALVASPSGTALAARTVCGSDMQW